MTTREAANTDGHTPGPWTIVEYGDGDSLAIHDGDSANRICFMATHGGSRKQWEAIQANARLIAAAPELLEVLQDAVANSERLDREGARPRDAIAEALFQRARSALSKATTQTQKAEG